MPNKTLYVKDTDVALFEQAQAQLGDSISAMFADFLRERVQKLTPEEDRIVTLIEYLSRQREGLQKDRNAPRFLDGEYAEAMAYAEKALKSFRRREISKTKIYFRAANTYREKADCDVREAKELAVKIAEMLKAAQ